MANRLKTRNHIIAVFVLLVFTVLPAIQGRAQVAGATVTGTVTDPSAANIPNAQVSVTNIATGITTNVSTNSAGFYTTPNLLPGPYQITIRAEGFQTLIRSGITLAVGGQQVLDAALTLGQTSQSVEVTGEAPTVELSSSTIGGVVTSNTVVELPLNGRSWTDLAALQPGVGALTIQPVFNSGADRIVRGFGDELSISGVRPQQNNYRLDGISLN